MIAVVYGTTGELIKLAPVLVGLRERGSPALTLCTGQQIEQIPTLLDDFGLERPDVWLARGRRGRDLEHARDLPGWLASVTASFVRRRPALRARLRSGQTEPLVLVHGDTFTTVLGAAMGRAMGVAVAHLEAGLRSGDWRNPFPEELDRLATSRLAQIHLAPGPTEVANLRAMGAKGDIVDTRGNTIKDALGLVPAGSPALDLPDEPFGVASLHRFELLSKPRAFGPIVELLREASRTTPILFIDHPVTAAAIASQRLEGLFGERLRRVPRQRYFQFIALLKASSFLVTDSGGSQEECAQLGHPCLIHRAATERFDGLDGGSVLLSRMDLDVVSAFLADPSAYARPPAEMAVSPSDVVLSHLQARGHLPIDMRPEAVGTV